MRHNAMAACLVLLSCSPVLADDVFTYVTDSRRCVASFGGNGGGSSYESPSSPFADYTGGAHLKADNGVESWAAHCDQMSSMDATHMMMMGGAAAYVDTSVESAINAQGRSTFDVYFTVNVLTPYRIVGSIGESGHAESVSRVRLSDWSGTTLVEFESETDTTSPIAFQGILQPGNYRLLAETQARVRTPPGNAAHATTTCSVLFSVPTSKSCRGDWNNDGAVNSVDFYNFIGNFLDGDADMNRDGGTNTEDFLDFMAAFFEDCN